jgi:glycosyltransferase involved in cell wall biosynthesis
MEISVIVPVYNKEVYVERCLQSCLSQSFNDYEIIVVDDGSTDNSSEKCDIIAKDNAIIKVFHTKNSGVTAARKFGIQHSAGKYICFVDADDELLFNSLQSLHQAMVQNDADEIIGTFVTQLNKHVSTGKKGWADSSILIKELLSNSTCMCVLWGILFKKELLDNCLDSPAQIRTGEDILMQILCLLKSPKVYFIEPKVYLYYKDLPNNRKMTLEDEILYDNILRKALMQKWEDYKNFFLFHQIKMYENFINEKIFSVYDKYYKHQGLNQCKEMSLADKIVINIPPFLSYLPIRIYKHILKKSGYGKKENGEKD